MARKKKRATTKKRRKNTTQKKKKKTYSPEEELNLAHHKEELRGVQDKRECPACHAYMKSGNRKNNKIEQPDVRQAGVLEDEDDPTVKARLEEADNDWKDMDRFDLPTARKQELRSKYTKNYRLFGYTAGERLRLTDEKKQLQPLMDELSAIEDEKREAQDNLEDGQPAVSSQGNTLKQLKQMIQDKADEVDAKRKDVKSKRPKSYQPTD